MHSRQPKSRYTINKLTLCTHESKHTLYCLIVDRTYSVSVDTGNTVYRLQMDCRKLKSRHQTGKKKKKNSDSLQVDSRLSVIKNTAVSLKLDKHQTLWKYTNIRQLKIDNQTVKNRQTLDSLKVDKQ